MSKEFGETDHLRSQVGNSGGFWQTPSAERPEFPSIVQRYASASAFRNALLARCRDAARKDKRFNSVTRLNLFTFDRFLARVFQHPEVRPDSWAVKGGTSLIARLQDALIKRPRHVGPRVS